MFLNPRIAHVALAVVLAAGLGACSMGGGGGQLSPGLSAPMNQPGARLNRVEALFLLNDFRRAQGAADVRGDTVLDNTAQTLAANYAKSGAAAGPAARRRRHAAQRRLHHLRRDLLGLARRAGRCGGHRRFDRQARRPRRHLRAELARTASTGCWCLTTDTEIIDCRGLKCPLPVLKMEKRRRSLPAGAFSSCSPPTRWPRSTSRCFCQQHGHRCDVSSEAETMRFRIVKG